MIDDREIDGNAEGLPPAKSAKGLGLQWVADSNIPADQLATSASLFFGKIDHSRNLAQKILYFISSVRSSNSHPHLLVIQQHHPLFQITPVLNTGLSLSEPLELYKGNNAI